MSEIHLTGSEWNVMECLWEKGRMSSMELVRALRQSVGWSKSTTLTVLKRMAEKGVISCESGGKQRVYAPCIERDAAVKEETESFLKRVYRGSVSLMVSSMTQKQTLSEQEIQELYDILEKCRKGK